MIARGDVYWVDFRGAAGAEIRKTRPAVVVSNSAHNAHMKTVTVVPLSSFVGPLQPQEVLIPRGVFGDGRPARLKTHQLRAVDKSRLGRKLGVLPVRIAPRLEASLREHLGLDD